MNGFLGDTDGITESKLISAAMTLDDDAIEAEKTGAVVAARVDSAGKLLEQHQPTQSRKLRQQVFPETLLQKMANHLRNTLGAFQ